MDQETGNKAECVESNTQGHGSRTFVNGLRVALSTPGAILLASAAGFGALANDAGMSLFNAIFMMAVFFALPAQVVTIMPWLTGARTALWQRLTAAHFVAITAWFEGMRLLPKLPDSQRMTMFLGIGTGMVTATLIGTALGFGLAGSVPPAISACLLFLTPIYFVLSLMAAARSCKSA